MPKKQENIQRCGAKNRTGGMPCQHPAGWATQHPGIGYCKQHGGNTRSHILKAARIQAAASTPMGDPVNIDPYDALLRCIWISAGEVQYCSDRISELDTTELLIAFEERQEGSELSYIKTNTEVRLHVWVQARRSALDALARYSKMAIDAGVAERQVALAERVGGMIGALVHAVLGDLELSPAQQGIAPAVVRKHLTAIAGGAAT